MQLDFLCRLFALIIAGPIPTYYINTDTKINFITSQCFNHIKHRSMQYQLITDHLCCNKSYAELVPACTWTSMHAHMCGKNRLFSPLIVAFLWINKGQSHSAKETERKQIKALSGFTNEHLFLNRDVLSVTTWVCAHWGIWFPPAWDTWVCCQNAKRIKRVRGKWR